MVQIDMNKPDRDLTPGVALWVVKECSAGTSRKGDRMLKLKLARVEDETSHMYDNAMLEGGGWGIGKKKLGAFVPADFAGDFDPQSIVGERFWVCTTIRTYEGKDSLSVDHETLRHGGYQRADEVPPGCKLPEPGAGGVIDVPF